MNDDRAQDIVMHMKTVDLGGLGHVPSILDLEIGYRGLRRARSDHTGWEHDRTTTEYQRNDRVHP